MFCFSFLVKMLALRFWCVALDYNLVPWDCCEESLLKAQVETSEACLHLLDRAPRCESRPSKLSRDLVQDLLPTYECLQLGLNKTKSLFPDLHSPYLEQTHVICGRCFGQYRDRTSLSLHNVLLRSTTLQYSRKWAGRTCSLKDFLLPHPLSFFVWCWNEPRALGMLSKLPTTALHPLLCGGFSRVELGRLYIKLYWSIVTPICGVYLWLLGATSAELCWTDHVWWPQDLKYSLQSSNSFFFPTLPYLSFSSRQSFVVSAPCAL